MISSMHRIVLLVAAPLLFAGCAVTSFLTYAIWPNYPVFSGGEEVVVAGLRENVDVVRRADGLWKISAPNEVDGMRVLGYLQARDRMAQLDIFRHLARGEVAALVGDRAFGDKSSLELDRLNRFLGFRRDAGRLYSGVSVEEKAALEAFVAGINAWIAEGRVTLEHRLLGVEQVREWTVEDSLAIYLMVMHGLSSNADREIRRLAIACAAGLDAVERIWPSDIDYSVYALPDEDLGGAHAVPPAIVAEIAAELPRLCERRRERSTAESRAALGRGLIRMSSAFETMHLGWSASNNWAVAGKHTRSGKPVLSTDPHLPHMNPPMLWGFDFGTPEYRVAGFALPGLHRVVFGHNGSVAWGATTNHVDRQDLVIHRPSTAIVDGKVVGGYEVDGQFREFEERTERFDVLGGESVEQTVRFTSDGPLMNDLTDEAADVLPLVSLRTVPLGRGLDLEGARALASAENTADFAAAIDQLDLGCSSWVAADTSGSIAYKSPCLLPIRPGWRGTFPIPGWTSRYAWKGFLPKQALPQSFDPERGWLATANNQIVPAERVPVTYNNDVSAPARFERISERLRESLGSIDPGASSAIHVDLVDRTWLDVRPEIHPELCRPEQVDDAAGARRLLCDWNGEMSPDSVAPTLYTMLTNALLDNALADELPGGADGELWMFIQSLVQFEAGARWLWRQPSSAAVWDDVRTAEPESRADMLERAWRDALADAKETFGGAVADWRWGEVRPFVLSHLFAGEGGALGWLLNAPPIAIGGGNETVFKNQFARSHRDGMDAEIGPIVRITIDMDDPWSARFALAGGQSGWPRSPFYANLLEEWAAGDTRLLTPPPASTDVAVRFVPPAD